MIEFSLLYALTIIFLSAFLPGTVLSLALLKKSDFSLIEKILIGCALGWIISALLPFAEFVFFGIKFSETLVFVNIGLFYTFAISMFVWTKTKISAPLFSELKKEPLKCVLPALVVFLFILNFFIRIQSLSPIYQELDPYFYIYVTQQIILEGSNNLDDKTAWYPELIVNHRTSPLLSYLEANWYTLYAYGKQFNNYILSLISNIYPPFAAAFAIFFLYLGLRAWYKPEYAFIASAIASFVPIFILKLAAGAAEIQAYAFFALAFFFAFFLWAHKTQNFLYMVFAGIGYFALSLGSASELVGCTVFLIFIVAHGITLFLLKKDMETFTKLNCVFIAFSFFAAGIKSLFIGNLIVLYAGANLSAVVFLVALFFIGKQKYDDEMKFYILGGLGIITVLILIFTPVGGIIKSIALSGLQTAQFILPLHRTIAEQGVSGAVFEPSLGFIGRVFTDMAGYLFFLPSFIANTVFAVFSNMLNFFLGAKLEYTEKENSMLMTLLFFSMIASFFSLYRLIIKKEDSLAWFFIALIFPIALVGLIKAKYIIYLGFFLSAGIAFILAEFEMFFAKYFSEANRKNLFYALLGIGILVTGAQFFHSAAPDIISAGFAPRFQDNPIALQQKFSDLCAQFSIYDSQDMGICAVSKDPVGYANKSINNQYNPTLCILSLLKDPFNQQESREGASFRCAVLNDYWIESMEWIRYNTENNSRITSWWDYGHWENFFGQRNAVIRNEHSSHKMITEIAHDYIMGTPEELKDDMLHYNSTYALFDAELLFSGRAFGGKYGALNYLACARNNLTTVAKGTGASMCEFENLWTQVYVPSSSITEQCDISFNQKGIKAYVPKPTEVSGGLEYKLEEKYCLGNATLANGQTILALYEQTRSADGTLKLHKAFLNLDYTTSDKKLKIYSLRYTKDSVWIENGTIVDGWEDRTSKFYDSVLYNAFVLEKLPGFELVYKTKGNEVKIFKISEKKY